MKRTHTIIAGLILAAGIGSTAFAQGMPGGGPMGQGGPGPMMQQGMQGGPGGQMGMGPMGRQGGQFDPAQRAERHLGMFKTQLKLTPEQEPLWQAFAEKMKAGAGKGRQAMQTQAGENLTAPERMAKMEAAMAEHLTTMKDTHESFNRLYAALTPEQKKIADQHFAQFGQGKKGGMGGRMGQGRMAPPAAPKN